MSTQLRTREMPGIDLKTSEMIDAILEWPEWKLRSICVEQSDIVLLREIEAFSGSTAIVSKELVSVHTKSKRIDR